MLVTAARRRLATGALLLLALATSFAFGELVRAPSGASERSSATIGTRVADDVHAMVAVPVRGTDWAVNQQRGAHDDERLVAVLLAAAVLLVAQLRRRAALASSRDRAAPRGSRTGDRGPPAFA